MLATLRSIRYLQLHIYGKLWSGTNVAFDVGEEEQDPFAARCFAELPDLRLLALSSQSGGWPWKTYRGRDIYVDGQFKRRHCALDRKSSRRPLDLDVLKFEYASEFFC